MLKCTNNRILMHVRLPIGKNMHITNKYMLARNFHVIKVNEQNSNVCFNGAKDIFIKNTQTKFDINSNELIGHIDRIRRIMGVSG